MEIGSSIIAPINATLAIESDNFNFLFIAINIVRHTAYFATFPKSLDDNNIPNNVDMNTGILYLSIFDAHIKKAIPKGATESTIIDLLSKNPITANAAVVKSIYPLINFMTFGFTVLFFTTATLLCIKKPPLLFILRIVTKRSNFFCHNRF
ncbi:hypothetical protein QCU_3427 [Clostridioides difficile CD68]|nr:hypothetical protein QCU_3427 [Clostridioides difficile CD68]EQF01064.1 hypothetical protein QEK_3771 [Clostridioides difficile CD131]EQF85059.1 hypothetical protein QGU_3502 [Clostridioides difficile 655]EQI55024.1 hypothetical protein QQ9_3581 [Clostridioides difficile Y312]